MLSRRNAASAARSSSVKSTVGIHDRARRARIPRAPMAPNRMAAVDGSDTGSGRSLVSYQYPSISHCVKPPQIVKLSLAINPE
jgi:hypothetical protein